MKEMSIKVINGKPVYICLLCNGKRSFKTLKGIRKHLKRHHEQQRKEKQRAKAIVRE